MSVDSKPCPKCGAVIPTEAPQALCPKCLFAAVAAPTEGGASLSGRVSPPDINSVVAAFPNLEILELVGQGGMGVVYRARQKSLNRVVALKLLLPERVRDEAFAERFTREAQALARLNHPHIVTIHDFGQAGEFFYLLMEYVDGVNLRQAMRAGRFTPEQALAIVPPLCDALQYAHDRGIVHRDIKPENLLLDKEGRVKVADFGIAKLVEPSQSSVSNKSVDPGNNDGWTRNSTAGTPGYMAPEQAATPQKVDRRADIYSLGVVFYEMLTGELPTAELRPPSCKVEIDVRLDEIVLRALQHSPELRFQTAADFRTQLETMVPSRDEGLGETQRSRSSPKLLKAGNCSVTTVERLATMEGQLLHGLNNRWQLVLDDRNLTMTRIGDTIVIPLRAISDLSLGRYPRAMNPVGLNLISLTYTDAGRPRQILFSPMEGYFCLPSAWNHRVAEWLAAIREAVIAAGGRAPKTTAADKIGVPASSKALLALPIVSGLVPIIGIAILALRQQRTLLTLPLFTATLLLVTFLICCLGIPMLLAWTRSRRPRLHTGRSPWAAVVLVLFIMLIGVAVGIGFLGWLYFSRSGSGAANGFGPVVERVLPAPAMGAASILDFETGALFAPPNFLEQRLITGDAVIGTQAVAWLRDSGGDAVVNLPAGTNLRLFEGAAVTVATNNSLPLRWDEIKADQVRSIANTPVFDRNKLASNSDSVFHATPARSPVALCFVTREGSLGVMEILARTDQPAGLRIRYKLLNR